MIVTSVPTSSTTSQSVPLSLGETLDDTDRTERLGKIKETEEKNKARDALLDQVLHCLSLYVLYLGTVAT